jgi:hypothetical protein
MSDVVYILEAGWYDDSRVIGVYASEDVALAASLSQPVQAMGNVQVTAWTVQKTVSQKVKKNPKN